MLVLTRGPQQSLHIGATVTVTVLAVLGDRVRIGISAPRELAIQRERPPRPGPDPSYASPR